MNLITSLFPDWCILRVKGHLSVSQWDWMEVHSLKLPAPSCALLLPSADRSPRGDHFWGICTQLEFLVRLTYWGSSDCGIGSGDTKHSAWAVWGAFISFGQFYAANQSIGVLWVICNETKIFYFWFLVLEVQEGDGSICLALIKATWKVTSLWQGIQARVVSSVFGRD